MSEAAMEETFAGLLHERWGGAGLKAYEHPKTGPVFGCPLCHSGLVEISGQLARCGCGWEAKGSPDAVVKSALAAKAAEAAPAAGEGFTRELFNAWHAAGLYASPNSLTGALTFVCPACPDPAPLDVVEGACRCSWCRWTAKGTPKEIVALALAARGAAPTAPAQPPAGATSQRLDWPRLYASLDARKFDLKSPRPPAVEVVKLGGVCIATQGNIQAIQAMAKAGKTAFLGALIASAMNSEADCFGLEAENSRGLAVVHFDTEQSPQDHFRVVQRALNRAQQAEQPPWLKSYCLTDLATDERRAGIEAELERAQQEHGGILFAILDGIADFIASPNDDKESFAFAAGLHALAIRHSTCVFVVIHENPASETSKTRGHLGSQCRRKGRAPAPGSRFLRGGRG